MHWTSLQVATLVVSALTPLTVAGVGYLVARAGRQLEAVQWANQTVILHRLQIFQEIAPGLNRLLCFASFVGSWKEITPQQVIAVKRQTDEAMYANRPLFSDELFAAYQEFMASQFATYAVTGGDALLRARISSQWGNRRDLPWWEGSLERLFAADDPASTDRVQAAYHKLSEAFRADLYVTRDAETILGARSARLVQPGRLAAAEVTE